MPIDLPALLTDHRNAALDQARQLLDAAESEDRAMTADEQAHYSDLVAKVKQLDGRIERVRDVTPPWA